MLSLGDLHFTYLFKGEFCVNVVETEKDWDIFLNLQIKFQLLMSTPSQFTHTLAFNSHKMNYYLIILIKIYLLLNHTY